MIAGLGDYHLDASTGSTGGGGSSSSTGTGGHGGGSTSTGTGGGMCNAGGTGDGGSGPVGTALEISVGAGHVCAVRDDDRTVRCWGSNLGGQIGLPKGTPFSSRAVPVDVGGTVSHVAAGAYHSCAVLMSGEVSCWGENSSGACGATPFGHFAAPKKIAGFQAEKIIAGFDFSCATLPTTNAVSCWGNGALGSLGSKIGSTATPTSTGVTNASAIATCPTCATACALVGAQVQCWGGAYDYALPVALTDVNDAKAIAVGNSLSGGSAEEEVVFVLRAGGDLVYTRRGGAGVFAPTTAYATGIKAVSVDNHVVAVDDTDNVLSSASFEYGMPPPALGKGLEPPPAGLFEILAGDGYDCARTSAGVFCVGANTHGQLGNGKAERVVAATKVASCAQRLFQGPNCATLELVDQSFVAFGDCAAYGGQARAYPVPVGQLLSTISFARTGPLVSTDWPSPSDQRGYFISDDPGIGFFELVDGTQQATPDIPKATDYTDILLGTQWDFALHASGQAELTALVDSPAAHGLFGAGPVTKGQQVTLAADGIAAARWAEHVCAWKGGALQCWGKNDALQALPGGTTSDVSAPVTVSITGVTQAVVGERHTCALAAGKVFCWGSNDYGQLGAPQPITGTNGTVQIQLPTAQPATKLASGPSSICAYVDGEQKVYCWGDNQDGACADGTLDSPATPHAVVGLSGAVVELSAGQFSVCALLKNGDVRCWGGSPSGQVGNGSLYAHYDWQLVQGL